MTLALHPAHLEDLRSSGITADTITMMQASSARPGDLNALAGWDITAKGVTSAIVFPYPGCDGFYQLKLFPPVLNGDGHHIRYIQPRGSEPRAYILPCVRERLADPEEAVLFAEGAKKAARLAQEGYNAVGVAAVWNWKRGKATLSYTDPDTLIPDLRVLVTPARRIFLVFDSDIWRRDRTDCRLGVYALGRQLQDLGAIVRVVRLPAPTKAEQAAGMTKIGADDFLQGHPRETFEHLLTLAIPLTHPLFSGCAIQWDREAGLPRVEPSAAAPAEAEPLHVPAAGMIGLARDFARVYASHLEAPASFFYFAYLTYLGALLSRKIILKSSLDVEPRLYAVLVGESSDTRKTTALRKTNHFFRSLTDWEPAVLLGVGSAEGLARALKDSPELLLQFDELKSFVSKAQADASVLLPMVGSLFELNEYDNRTKEGSISVRKVSLSLLAACTQDTYATMFDRRFHAIGFLNRLWLVADRTTAKIAVPDPIRAQDLDGLQKSTMELLKDIQRRYRENTYQRVEFGLTKRAHAVFEAWYLARQGTIFEKRLETYGHRLMLLLAAMTGKGEVDEQIATAVVELLKYQLEARRECDPVDAENTVAILEERIRRALARGAMTGRTLRYRLHYDRVGLWLWNTAIENLRKASELRWDRKTDLYWIVGDTRGDTTVKNGLKA